MLSISPLKGLLEKLYKLEGKLSHCAPCTIVPGSVFRLHTVHLEINEALGNIHRDDASADDFGVIPLATS